MTKRKIITAVIAVILILAAGAYKLYLQGEEAKILTGTVEATKADVTPRLGGYLRERTVKEGDSVTAGQIIARLDKLPGLIRVNLRPSLPKMKQA